MKKAQLNKPTTTTHQPLFLLTLILLLAFWLRLYRLPDLPPGLNFDEAGNGVAALDILHGLPRLWWPIGGGKEPLWPYLIALTTAGLGNIPLALRLPAALTGVLTVAAVYPLTLVLFRTAGYPHPRHARTIALLAMLGVAVSAWHLHFSRLGFRAVLMPLLSAAAFYFLWRGQVRCPAGGLTTRAPRHAIFINLALASLFTALAVYAYLAARLLPLIPLLFTLTYGALRKHRRHTRCLVLFIANYLFLTFIFLLPPVFYFLLNPADLLARSATVSIFNPAWNHGDLPGAAWRTLRLTLGTFIGLRGDANPLVNLPGQPAIPPWLAPFFILGIGYSLYHTLRRRPTAVSPHLFLLCWWGVMLLPAVLAPEGAPHHLRLIGALVPTYIFVALGLTTAADFLAGRLSRLPAVRYLLPAVVYLLLTPQTFTHYFIRWPASADFTLPFDLYAVRLADQIADAPPEVDYILPMDIRAGREARHYTLDYLLADRQPPGYRYIPVNAANAQAGLQQAARTSTGLRVVRWTADKHREADAKEIVTFLLETNARLTGRRSFPVYDIETYLPAPGADFTLPAIDRPIAAVFDGKLRLDAVYLPASAFPGDWLAVGLTLTPLAPMDVDYKVSLRLARPGGERVAQKDRVLLHTYHQGTSLWPPETVNEYYLLPVPADATSGNYTVTVVIYHPDTLTPLVADGQAELPLGQVRID